MTTTANPMEIPRKTGYTFKGYYTGENGTGTQIITGTGYLASDSLNVSTLAGGINSQYLTLPTPRDLRQVQRTMYAYWEANSYALNVSYEATGGATATFTKGEGVTDGATVGQSPYTIKTGTAANFTVTPADGFAIFKVEYSTNQTTWKSLTATETTSAYTGTIPADSNGSDYYLRVTIGLPTSAITYDVLRVTEDGSQIYARYSIYTGTKSLVLFKCAAGVTGITLADDIPVFATTAYAGYDHAALIDLNTALGTSVSEDAFKAYMKGIVSKSSTANTSLEYDYNVNGSEGTPVFKIDDISVEYDYTRLANLAWTPSDAYLIIGDVVGATEDSTSDRYLDAHDVSAFVTEYNTPST